MLVYLMQFWNEVNVLVDGVSSFLSETALSWPILNVQLGQKNAEMSKEIKKSNKI